MAYILINIPGISADTADTISIQYEWQVYGGTGGVQQNGASALSVPADMLGTLITQTVIDQCVLEANAGGSSITSADRKIILNSLN